MAVGKRLVNPNDFRLELIKEANGNTLVINWAGEEDDGDYVCQVNTYPRIEIKHNVKMRGRLDKDLLHN